VTNANRKRQLAVETAAKEGLRASVPLYIAAAEAFAQEDRPAQGVELLGELLRAKEKRRGLLGRVEKNPLGPERVRVATKYCEFSRTTSPTEDTLEMLADLANEFSDVAIVRRANADALRNAGYASDSIDEYRYCWKLEPEDGDIPVRLSELYAALGRNDEAIDHLRKGIALHAASGQFEQVADRAMRFIDINPDELDDVFSSMALIPGEVLKKHVPSLDHLGVLVRRDPSREPQWRTRMEQRLVDLYARVLEADNRNGAARRGINVLGQQYLAEVENKLRNAPKPATAAAAAPAAPETPAQAVQAPAAQAPAPAPAVQAPAAPAPAAQPPAAQPPAAQAPAAQPPAAQTPAAQPPAAPAKPEPAAPQAAESEESTAPELVEKSPGELVTEETPEIAAAVEVAPQAATTEAKEATPPTATAPAPAAANAPAPEATTPAPAAASTPAPVATTAAAPTPAAPSRAIYAFALRKAQEQYDAGSYEEAAQACDRILKRGDIPEVLTLLAHCYMKLERKPDAVKACLRFADAQAADDPTKALDALTELIKELPDAALILRRSQLLTKIRQVERV
jgi:tetratricopeptide (TPR) repeat protein